MHRKQIPTPIDSDPHCMQPSLLPPALFGRSAESVNQTQDTLIYSLLNLFSEITKGILIFRMIQDSPADRAGLRPGDIITHINGSPITASQDIYKFLEDDCNLYVTIMRRGKVLKILVDLES